MTIAIVLMIVSFGVLSVLDYVFTSLILSLGGRELNPLMAWVIEHDLFGLSKLALFIIVSAILLWLRFRCPTAAVVLGCLAIIVYGYVVAHNHAQLKR